MNNLSGSQSSNYFILYVSYATREFSQNELELLWKKSANKNADLNISGMLLYLNQRFIQVLEGEKDQVKSLYSRIQKDKRHENVMTVIEGQVTKRNFENWSMGFHHIDSSEEKYISAGAHILEKIDQWEISSGEHPALEFVKMFYLKQNNQTKSVNAG